MQGIEIQPMWWNPFAGLQDKRDQTEPKATHTLNIGLVYKTSSVNKITFGLYFIEDDLIAFNSILYRTCTLYININKLLEENTIVICV